MKKTRIFCFLLPLLILAVGSSAFGSPTISLSPTNITANMSGVCSGNPAAQNVTISNSGNGTLASPTIQYTYNQGSGWLNAVVTGSSAPYTLQVNFQNTCGLALGTYSATLAISSSGASNSPVNLPITLNVGTSGGSPTISLSSTSLSFDATAGGSNNPAAQNVTVSNSGGGTLASPTTSITYGSGSGWLSVNCSGSSAPYMCSNQPSISGLSAGTYDATVNVSSSGATNSPQSYTVTLNVNPSGSPAISLSPTSVAASMTGVCSGNPATQNVTINNSGGGTLVTPTIQYTYNQGSGWLDATVTGSSAPYTLQVAFQNTCGLALGTYTATIAISSSGASNSPVNLPVTLTVGSSGSPVISLSPTSVTANQSGVCSGNPAAQNVNVSNSGGGTLASPTIQYTYNQGSGWLNAVVTGSSAPYTLQVNFQNTCSLALGTYTATLAVSSSGASNSPVNLPVTLNVGSSSSPTISLSPTSLSFSATAGGSNPAAQDVTVSNSSGGTLAPPTTSITYGSGGSGWLTVTKSGSQAPYTLSNQPSISGLADGTYTATVNVSSSGATNSPQSYTVTLTVSSSSPCVMTALNNTSNCGPYTYTPVQESGGDNVKVGQGAWNPVSGMSETTTVPLPFNGSWNTIINIPGSASSGVKTYPSIWTPYQNELITSFHNMYSTFSATADTSSNTSSDVGFDMFFYRVSANNYYADEVMIQTAEINVSPCTGSQILATVQFGGSNGVPVNSWNFCRFANSNGGYENIWQITGSGNVYGFTTGSVDILSMLNWLVNNGYMPSTDTFTSVAYGFEVLTTSGVNETFSMSSFSITQN